MTGDRRPSGSVWLVRTPLFVAWTDDFDQALAEAKGAPGPAMIEQLWPQDLPDGVDLDAAADGALLVGPMGGAR